MPPSFRIEEFEKNARFQPTEELSKGKVCAKYKSLSLGPFIHTCILVISLVLWYGNLVSITGIVLH